MTPDPRFLCLLAPRHFSSVPLAPAIFSQGGGPWSLKRALGQMPSWSPRRVKRRNPPLVAATSTRYSPIQSGHASLHGPTLCRTRGRQGGLARRLCIIGSSAALKFFSLRPADVRIALGSPLNGTTPSKAYLDFSLTGRSKHRRFELRGKI
ncbi:hypothetical protein CLAIMM_02592 [Cladophialophora immunda]|nr:hypothetical protein CLAIMM_02592 [Cladophialophora immunda]